MKKLELCHRWKNLVETMSTHELRQQLEINKSLELQSLSFAQELERENLPKVKQEETSHQIHNLIELSRLKNNYIQFLMLSKQLT